MSFKCGDQLAQILRQRLDLGPPSQCFQVQLGQQQGVVQLVP